MWTPNQSISDGKYIIQNVLGEGGFGITYSAKETSTGEIVAIKTLNGKRQRAKDFPKQQERFVNEAFNLRAFSHPHVVKVHKMIQEDGLWGMVMEYIDGVDLHEYVEQNGQLSEHDALLYIDQIGQALEYIHQQDGMIHRDIKPQNIVLRSGKKETALIDFGLACKLDKMTTRDGRTDGYAPIEQYGMGTLGFFTDVYALAATLYYLLTVDGLNHKDEYIHPSFVRKLGPVELPPPQYYNSRISKRVNDAIMKGMELEIADRPQTMGEFRQLLGLISPPPPIGFTENLSNGVFLEMVAIPGGKFLMGSPAGEGDDDEKPQHEVTVPPFYLGKYPVTQAQWERVAVLPKVNIDLNPKPSYFQGANRPVEQVSWLDAQEFCARLSKATGKLYRLPSEAEWEYACRSKTTTQYYFGDTITTDLANFEGHYQGTTDVGKFPANAFGLYDMHGNVWEWCEDDWHENYINAPTDGSAWNSRSGDSAKLLRGGSWFNYARNCRSAYRRRYSRDARSYIYGFRVAFSSRTL